MKAKIVGSAKPLYGRVMINGSKNAALPIIAACLLTSDPITLHNIPNILDVTVMCEILKDLGANVEFYRNPLHCAGHTLKIQMTNNHRPSASNQNELSKKLRASILIVGPLLARFGKAFLPPVGGCKIGSRGVDIHLSAFENMGAELSSDKSEVHLLSNLYKLQGRIIHLEQPSVGATENILMAASLAEGVTIITNAALEPDVADLTNFLVKMGAKIQGIGRRILRIQGVSKLHGCEYRIIPDRHEAATFALAAIITGGVLELEGIAKSHFSSTIRELENIGGQIISTSRGNENVLIAKRRSGFGIIGVDIVTNPYPNFPTDMQAPFCTLLCLAQSKNISFVHENIFENRFQHIPQLQLMGANVEICSARTTTDVKNVAKNYVIIRGSKFGFHGATVKATDLRAAVSLVLAGLVANGETVIENIEHLLRGFEDMDQKLKTCGADISIMS